MPFYIAYLVLPGFDAVRHQWSHVPLGVKVIIQEDRGHKVITTGPYKFVRHPMYIGATILMICLPIALGSLYALIPLVFCIIFVIIRTALEDKTLHNELEGYAEYAKRTKYRLIPGIW